MNFISYPNQQDINLGLVRFFKIENNNIVFYLNAGNVIWFFTSSEEARHVNSALRRKFIEKLRPDND